MTSINLSRTDAISNPTGVASMTLAVASANGITTKLFVKQRVQNTNGSTSDEFVTIANVVDIANTPEDAPNEDLGKFRTASNTFVGETVYDLNGIFDEAVLLLETVCKQTDDLAANGDTTNYVINADGIAP